MLRLIVRRLLGFPFLLLGIVTVTFFLARGVPADPLAAIIGDRQMNNPEVVAAARARWGLDRPLWQQYLIYLEHFAQGDLGISIRTKRPVLDDLAQRLPATLELTFAAMAVGTLGGIGLGTLAARFKDRWPDHVARGLAILGSSVPIFWSGLIALYLFSVSLRWSPGPGRLDARATPPDDVTGFYTVDALLAGQWPLFLDAAARLALPALILGWAVVGMIARLVRASLLDVLDQDYIWLARAKGVNEGAVMVRHALRNALLPALTVIGFSFAYLITGAILTEGVFAWPGVGSYAVAASRALDYPAIMGVTLVAGAAFLLCNLLTDLSYLAANPRLRRR